jgi:hypothetical protein
MIIHVYGLTPQGEVQHVLLVHLYNLAPQSVTVTHSHSYAPPTRASAVVYSRDPKLVVPCTLFRSGLCETLLALGFQRP